MLWEMFVTFLKIGAFTFGGGFAMIPIIQNEIVDKRKWISNEEFMDAISISQASPGPIATNTSIFIGYKLKGLRGALVSMLGTVLPSIFIIVIIAKFFYQFRDNAIIEKVFLGIRPAVVALILTAVYKIAFKTHLGYDKMVVGLVVALIIVFLKISPIYLVIVGALGYIVVNKVKEILYNRD
jgi:chromate transporter